MTTSVSQTGISFKYILVALAAVLFSWFVHELAHWATGEALGIDMAMTLNKSYSKSNGYSAGWQEMIISAAGPFITIVQAFLFYFLLRRNGSNLLFPFLLTPLYMRTLAGVMNFINLNDEGRISRDLGIGPLTLPLIVFALLFFLVYRRSSQNEYTGKFITTTVLLIMLFSSVLILVDQAMRIIIIS